MASFQAAGFGPDNGRTDFKFFAHGFHDLIAKRADLFLGKSFGMFHSDF